MGNLGHILRSVQETRKDHPLESPISPLLEHTLEFVLHLAVGTRLQDHLVLENSQCSEQGLASSKFRLHLPL